MSIADNAAERGNWTTAALRIKLQIDDLRYQIDIAVQALPPDPATLLLVEADVDLADAQALLLSASGKIGAIQ